MANLTQIQIPSTNQPVDYDILNTIVSTVNSLSTAVTKSISNSDSSIFGAQVASNIIKIIATTNNPVSETEAKVDTISTIQISFGTNTFSSVPFVTVTPRASNSTNFAACSYFISNLTATGCTINVKWISAKKPVNMWFDVLAIGVPVVAV
jgi:hypothetical protein